MQRAKTIVMALAAALCTSAHAGDAHLTLKTLTWDPRQPDATPYRDTALDDKLLKVVNDSWSSVRPNVIDNVVKSVTQKPIKSGVSLYDVDFQLPATPDVQVQSAIPSRGALRLWFPHASMSFKATTPLTSRDTDPRLGVTFDLAVFVSFRLNGGMNPPIEVTGASSQTSSIDVSEDNVSAVVASIVSEIVSGITNGPTLKDMIANGIANSAPNLTGTVASALRANAQQLAIPPGYTYNGGYVETGRITIAAWKPATLPKADIPVLVTWDGKYGRLIPNCEPLLLKVTMPYAPPPYGGKMHIDSDNYPSATPGSAQTGPDFVCTQSIAGVAGVSGTLKYKEWVVEVGHPRTPGIHKTVQAVPVGWSNPLVVGDATRGRAQFRLDVREGMHDGSLEHDKAQEVLSRKPGDPVERSVNPAVNNAAQARTNPASTSLGNAPRVADDLNPQPLPPGPSGTERKAVGATRVVPPAASSSAPGVPASSLTGR
jgi:hypothetical protein